MELKQLLDNQRKFFQTGMTLPISFRLQMLEKLKNVIQNHETEISAALQEDLGKSSFESFMSELGLVKGELNFMLRHTRSLAAKHYVHSPLNQFCSISYKKPSPYGCVLIMSPWNYPFLLTIDPLIDAIAAGNTVILKPSAYSPATTAIIQKLIAEVYPPEYVAVVSGGRKENADLLNQKFDFIFFTGSQKVGKEVLRRSSENLIPTVLELGGKSPCIVDDTAKIRQAARRIVFGKFLNCGQTCVAPDYILCDKAVKEKLLQELIRQIKKQFGENPLDNKDYGHIINQKHFDRLNQLIHKEKLAYGGESNSDKLQISPTILDNVNWDDKVMQEEIFGPILPIITYDQFEDLFSLLANKPKPLALYIFSGNRKHIEEITSRISYGGGCINDTMTHLATATMPFGGVGESGMGEYHGKEGFKTFSHTKSIMEKKKWLDIPVRYQPYTSEFYKFLMHLFLR